MHRLAPVQIVTKFDFFGKVELLGLLTCRLQKFNFTEEVELRRSSIQQQVCDRIISIIGALHVRSVVSR